MDLPVDIMVIGETNFAQILRRVVSSELWTADTESGYLLNTRGDIRINIYKKEVSIEEMMLDTRNVYVNINGTYYRVRQKITITGKF